MTTPGNTPDALSAPANRTAAVATVQISNDHFIVTEWRFPPGSETGWHTHGHNYVVVPQTNGALQIETLQGNNTFPLIAGQSYARSIGVHHNVVNLTQQEVVFVEIESL
jgi:quercetin dioxygenase-like cupin family protein